MKYPQLTKKKPEKRLLKSLKQRAGRAKSGRITIRHRGGGVKRRYRIIDWNGGRIDQFAKVIALEYDPYRTAFIVLLEYPDGEKRYRLAPHNLKVGDEIMTSEKAAIKVGNRMRLKNIPVGIEVFNIELAPGKGGQLVRGAGTSAKVSAHEEKYSQIEMPSKEIRKLLGDCFATIGQVSNPEHRYQKLGKAGTSRLKGRRPEVRGSAMSPYAHPHGGGEGRTGIGMPSPKTPWGKLARGVRTRKRKWTNKYIIKRRERKKKK